MIKDLLKQGFILKSSGYYKHAIESFYKALEIDNSSLELLLEIADCYFLLGNEERSLNYIEQILEKEPNNINALKLLKKMFVSKGAWEEALQSAKNIYSISKEQKDLVEVLKILNKIEKYNEVINFEIKEFSAEILYEKAYANLFLNNLSNAIDLINKSLGLDSNERAQVLKCKILYKMNRQDECVELFNTINLGDDDAEVLNFAGIVKQYECEFKKALEYFISAIKLDSQNDEYYYNYASTCFKMGEIQQAKKYYNLAISLAPENQNYHFALANLYYSEKNYKRAIEELNYDFFEARLLKSIILYDSGYLAVAKKELENLALEEPENELVIEYRNRIEEELKF